MYNGLKFLFKKNNSFKDISVFLFIKQNVFNF